MGIHHTLKRLFLSNSRDGGPVCDAAGPRSPPGLIRRRRRGSGSPRRPPASNDAPGGPDSPHHHLCGQQGDREQMAGEPRGGGEEEGGSAPAGGGGSQHGGVVGAPVGGAQAWLDLGVQQKLLLVAASEGAGQRVEVWLHLSAEVARGTSF